MIELDRLYALARDLAAADDLVAAAAVITARGREWFAADATCTYARRADARLELLAEMNCTERFKTEWRFIPAGALSLARDGLGENVYIGSADAFKQSEPATSELVEHSGRRLIGYAPLRAGARLVGVFGFSYDGPPPDTVDENFVQAFAGVAALGLMRFVPAELATDVGAS